MQQTKALVSLRYVTRIAAVIILIAVAVGFFLPKDYRIERSITVSATDLNKIEQRLLSAPAWQDWLYIEGGSLKLTEPSETLSEQTRFSIQYDADVDKHGAINIESVSTSQIDFVVVPNQKTFPIPNKIVISRHSNGQAEVQWIIEGELDAGFLSSYLAMLANIIAGSNIERSLQNLQL